MVTQSRWIIIGSAISVFFYWWWHCLPEPLFSTPYSNVLFDRNNRLLEARLADDEQWRFPSQSVLPENYITALVTYEDARFYDHHGVDVLALFRATYQNLRAGKVVSGGSTLTMQLVRMANENPPRTYFQKLKEVFQALRIESKYSKQEILNFYAAHAPFGGNVVGLSAASWRYFGREVNQLSWAESTLLAVLPNSPSQIRPDYNQEALYQKRNRLLKKLFNLQCLSKLDYELAITEPLPDKILGFPRLAPHLLESLSNQSKKLRIRSSSTNWFESTLDSSVQSRLESIRDKYARELVQQRIHHFAALVVNNESGEVVGYLGNANYDFIPESGNAIDLVHRPRSTGSILKPFLYGVMLEDGLLTPEQLVQDTPIHYEGYTPENYDLKFRGVVPAKQALAQSLNVPSVNMLREYGLDPFLQFLVKGGVTTLFRSADEYGLPLILGGAEGTLWEMTQLYSQLSQIAQSRIPIPLKISKNHESKSIKGLALSSGSAWLTLEALIEVNRPGNGGHWKNYSSSRKIAWKTGTSFGFRDAWSIGTTPEYTVGVWVGNAEGTGVAGLTGTQAAAPIMLDIFNLLPKTSWFAKPEYNLKSVSVCKNDGYLSNRYCQEMKTEIPLRSNYSKQTPFHSRIHTDISGQYQVSTSCELLKNMKSVDWFALPPHVGHYYQKINSDYLSKPKWREDCVNVSSSRSPISFIYPKKGTRAYLPMLLDGNRSTMVAHAAHSQGISELYWYLNDRYLGKTSELHKMEVSAPAGRNELLVVDQDGNQKSIDFQILGETERN